MSRSKHTQILGKITSGLGLLFIAFDMYGLGCDATNACQDVCNQVYAYSAGKLRATVQNNTCSFDTAANELVSNNQVVTTITCVCDTTPS